MVSLSSQPVMVQEFGSASLSATCPKASVDLLLMEDAESESLLWSAELECERPKESFFVSFQTSRLNDATAEHAGLLPPWTTKAANAKYHQFVAYQDPLTFYQAYSLHDQGREMADHQELVVYEPVDVSLERSSSYSSYASQQNLISPQASTPTCNTQPDNNRAELEEAKDLMVKQIRKNEQILQLMSPLHKYRVSGSGKK